ncbi:hypothetical protein DID80_06875 [Candidatus Marinamargulisbacteria bacterium SCGC AAA071-K20]|nr:hypothetical protein DID80_06875 [Candidatus Marinamargulisbacteria bacterium SCGC AAA071-K20]
MFLEKSLRDPWFRSVSFYFWYGLYLLNEWTLNNRKVANHIWDFLKCQLFYIDGGCQNSGQCCKKLRLTFFGKSISTFKQFKKLLKKNISYKSFIPEFKKNGGIKHFSCSNLSDDNLCQEYLNRPQLCKNYPYSGFLVYDYIRQGCGYKVKQKQKYTHVRSHSLNKRIKKVCLLNKLV